MADASTTQLQGWIDRMNAGDAAARDQLINHTCNRLHRLTRKLLQAFPRLQHWEDTDDVLQNALVRLFRALQAASPGTVRQYFSLAATEIRRELLDLTRHYFGPEGAATRRAVDDAGSAAQPANDRADAAGDPARLMEWSELHRQVEALPVREREVFGLLWYHGMTQAEAAAVLHVSEPTVKRWWLSAKLRLQQALHGERPSS
jgi:RNA polymerase sigma-70 factor (ECF subfamily)